MSFPWNEPVQEGRPHKAHPASSRPTSRRTTACTANRTTSLWGSEVSFAEKPTGRSHAAVSSETSLYGSQSSELERSMSKKQIEGGAGASNFSLFQPAESTKTSASTPPPASPPAPFARDVAQAGGKPSCLITCMPWGDAPMTEIDANFEAELSKEFNILTLEEARAAAEAGGGVSCVVSACHGPVDGALLDSLVPPGVDLRAGDTSNLKAVVNYGVGVDHINLQDCRDRGVPVGHTPGVLTEPTADMGFALLLATARRVVEGDKFVRAESGKSWTKYDNNFFLGQDVSGSTVGIVGMGRIGLALAKRAHYGFNMKVLYHNRRPSEDAAAVDGEYVSLEELLRRSDHVVLVCPCTKETTGLINRDRLALMKPTATLVNIARGPVVDTQALLEALQRGAIFGAGLDVTEPGSGSGKEPLTADHQLFALDNVVITPHRGSSTARTRKAMLDLTVANMAAAAAAEPMPAPCNLWQQLTPAPFK